MSVYSNGQSQIFFYKQETAYEVRISGWSSYLCSYDLALPGLRAKTAAISEVVASARAFRDSLCLDGWDDKAIAALPDPDALHRLDVALGRLPDVLEEGAALSEVDAATSVEAAATPACACREAQFDVTSPAQEALAIQFCEEIAGRQGERGSPPAPVRLLRSEEHTS